MEQDNEEYKEKKIGFFRKLAYSITKFEKYPEMAAEGMPRALIYLTQIMLVFSIIVAAGLVYKLYDATKKGINYVENSLPEITYSKGILDVNSNDVISIDTKSFIIDKVMIDTKTDNEEQIQKYIDLIPKDGTGIIALKDRIIIKAEGINGQTTYKYTDILSGITNKKIDALTKQDILNYLTSKSILPLYIMFFLLMTIYVFIIYIISVAFDTLIIAFLGNITILFTKLKLKFLAVYNMAIYSLTLSILLNAIYITISSITGFEMKYFQIMYTSIAYVCLVAALFMIRADFVKKQSELIKIMQEQEKISEEMNGKEEKDKEDKKPEEEPKDNDSKEDDTEPSGSEA